MLEIIFLIACSVIVAGFFLAYAFMAFGVLFFVYKAIKFSIKEMIYYWNGSKRLEDRDRMLLALYFLVIILVCSCIYSFAYLTLSR